jgi:hypothetical protein
MAIPAPIGVAAAGKPNSGDQANAVISGSFSAIGPGKAFAFRGPMNLAIWGSINVSLATTNGSSSATVGSATGLAVGNGINSVNVPPGTTIGALVGTTATLAFPTQTYWGSISATGQLTVAGIDGVAAGLVGSTVTTSSNAFGVVLPANTTIASLVQAPIAPSLNSPGQPAIFQLSAVPTTVPQTSQPIPFDFALTNNSVTTGTDTKAVFTGWSITYTGSVQLEYSFDGGATWLCANIGGSGGQAIWAAGTPVRITFGEPERQVLYRPNCTAYTPVSNLTLNYRASTTGQAAETLSIGLLS